GEGRHVLQPAAGLLAVQIDARPTDRDDVQAVGRCHVQGGFHSHPPPLLTVDVTHILTLERSQRLFHSCRAGREERNAESLRFVDELSNANEITSACARHMEVDKERNLRISASRTCRTTVAGLATGLTRLSLIDRIRHPCEA